MNVLILESDPFPVKGKMSVLTLRVFTQGEETG
jgi:hypothetical protein